MPSWGRKQHRLLWLLFIALQWAVQSRRGFGEVDRMGYKVPQRLELCLPPLSFLRIAAAC